jgi:serine/threonine-protein kinase
MRDALYARAQAIAHEVLDQTPDARDAHMAALCADDLELRREVQWLISAADDDSLDAIPAEVIAAASAINADLRIDAVAPGRYRLLERIGEGAMGVVWLAEREVGGALQRVALKRLRIGSLSQHARFREEQRILAALNHPNIAHLIDAGDDRDGAPFLAMEYVAGVRIDHWCAARNLSLRERIELFLKVCAALSYAHERLVIHRDLKPANILVDASGEPKLLDFGIARLIDGEAALHTATRLMTPAYASPEQIDGKPLGTATDIWSLGVMLYELLAGARPFEHLDSDHARAMAIVSGAVTPPSQQAPRRTPLDAEPTNTAPLQKLPRIPADIDAIVLKALRREPEQRYVSVRDFADDLNNFLSARPVKARRGQWAYRTQRFARRNRWPLAMASVLLAVILGFTWRTVLAEREARLQAQVAERTTEFLISTFALSDPSQAGRHDFTAREVLDRGRSRIDTELVELPRVRARLLEALGNAYRGINEGSAGASLLEAAAQLNLDPAVNDPLAAARNLRAKALGIMSRNGATNEVEHAAQRAFELVRAHANDDPLALADAYGTLARALDVAGKEAPALSAAQHALRLREHAKANPLSIAQSLYDLCLVSSGAGQHRQARQHCERARVLYLETGATRSNAYRLTLRQLESTLVYSGEYDAGLVIARERIALTAQLFGADSTVLAMEQLSFTDRLAEHGLFDEAAGLLAQGMPVILRRNGADSVQYAQAVFHAGWLAFLRGEFDLAVPQLEEALSIHERVVEGRDLGLLHVLRTTLAQALIESGHANARARELLDTVIAERSAAGAQSVGLVYARLPLAQWHAANGQFEAAQDLLDQVDAVGSSVEMELHARAAATRALIASARDEQSVALHHAQSAYAMILKDRGVENPRTARYALAYAQALRASGNGASALALEHDYQGRLIRAYPPGSAFVQLLSSAPHDR